MDGKSLARIGAVVFVALAITTTVIEMNRSSDRQDDPAPLARSVTDRDPLRAELARCGSIGEAGARDPSCLRTWAENRRRFLGQPRRTTSPAPDAPTTMFPSAATEQPAPIPSTPDRNGSR